MSVKKLHLLIIATTLSSGCSSLGQAQAVDGTERSSWFGNFSLSELLGKPAQEDTSQDPEPREAAAEPVPDSQPPELLATPTSTETRPDQTGTQTDAAAPEYADLWERLRAGFTLNHDVDNERVHAQLNWYATHPSYIKRVADRGSRYLFHILSETEKRGLPTEFALLPVVESAFDPFAYSHGRQRACGSSYRQPASTSA